MQGVNSVRKNGAREDPGNTVQAWTWRHACGCMWELGKGGHEKPTASSHFLFSGCLFDCVPFSSLLLQEFSTCPQPVLLGFCIKEGLMYPFCLPRGRHLHVCYLLCLHSSLDSQPILFYVGITQWSKRDIREATRKAVGVGGRKRRLRWSQEF